MKKLWLMAAGSLLILSGAYAQNSNSMKNKQVKISEKVKINYLQSGSGDTTLLFLHGWCINSGYWKDQIDYFSKNFSVYAIDLPGFGQSEAPDRTAWSIEEYAADVVGFVQKEDLKNVVLIGHSMSGDIILQVALGLPSKIIGVVGVDNFQYVGVEFSPEDMKEMANYFDALKSDFAKNAPAYSEKMLFQPSTPAVVKENVMNDIASTNPTIGYKSLESLMQHAEKVPGLLEKLPLKLYLINSSAVPTHEEGLKTYCKNGFHIELVGATGHYPMVEKPDAFNKALDNILLSIK